MFIILKKNYDQYYKDVQHFIDIYINGNLKKNKLKKTEAKQKNEKNEENLEEAENFESKYLQNEGEEKVKTERVVLKLQLTNGEDTFFGFEYEILKSLNNILNEKFPKLLIGPNVEVRRGIFYLKNNNVKFL